MKKRPYEIRSTDNGDFDEFMAWGADVHLERMDTGHYWVGIKDRNGDFHHLNLYANGFKNLKITHEREV